MDNQYKTLQTAGEFLLIFQNFSGQYAQYLQEITAVVIGSVVPPQTQIIAKVLRKLLNIKPIIVNRDTQSAVHHSSNQMGTDLYANAVAAHYLYPEKKKIIVDFGTALTLLGIQESGEISGVIIAPGVITALNALVSNTAQLPAIELKKPKRILGMDTETCMQSGIMYGYAAMVEGLVNRAKEELGADSFVISTGGLGHIYKPLIANIDIDDKFHTIKGLCLLYDLVIRPTDLA